MKRRSSTLFAALAVSACFGGARAAVTLTHDTTNSVYVLQNDYIAAAVSDSNYKLVALYKLTGPSSGTGINHVQPSYPAYLNRVNAKSAVYDGTTFKTNWDGDDSDAKMSMGVTGTITPVTGSTFGITQVYRLRDHSRTLEGEMAFANNTGAEWTPASVANGVESIAYLEPNGTMSGSEAQVKTASGLSVVTTGTVWFGNNSGAQAELTDGFVATLNRNSDPTKVIDLVLTWDLAKQKAHSQTGVTTNKVLFGSNRFQIEPLFTTVASGETLTYTQNITVDDGLPSISFASPDNLLAGISLNNTAYNQGATGTAAFTLSNLSYTQAATYGVKNIQLVDSTGTPVPGVTIPAISSVSVAAASKASASRQFVLPAGITAGVPYAIVAELDDSTGAKISTLFSKPFLVNTADVKVQLYQDPGTGLYVLENENVKAVIDPALGRINELYQKSGGRNQAIATYPMLRDFIAMPSNAQFSGYVMTLDPNGTDSPTKKSIAFLNAYNSAANLNKTITLESLSKSLQVDLQVQNANVDPISGQGFFSDVPAVPGGTGGAEDQFFAKSASGLLAPHKASTRYWFGAVPQADNTTLLAGAQPALSEGWMAAADTTNTDAVACTWDLAKQIQYAQTPTDGTAPTPLSAVYEAGGFGRHVFEAHFNNIPVGDTLNTTLYVVADTGFKNVSYAEGNRVMAGTWTDQADVTQGTALNIALALSNAGAADRTFDLKAIRIVKDSGEITPAGADQTGITLTGGAHVQKDVAFTLPADQALGTYAIFADLYEGTAKLSTLQSLPFTVSAGLPAANGDVNGDGKVDTADAVLALQIAAGIQGGDANQVARGDVLPTTPGLTMEDAAAIARMMPH